jgi:hypothetical protein
MRKYFDHAFEGFCNTMEPLADLAIRVVAAVIITVIYATIPLWIVPYVIFFRDTEEKED